MLDLPEQPHVTLAKQLALFEIYLKGVFHDPELLTAHGGQNT